MPTYRFMIIETEEEYEEFMSISAVDKYLQDNPGVKQLMNGAPLIHSGRGLKKPDDGFRDLLKTIKKGADKGIVKSTINTM